MPPDGCDVQGPEVRPLRDAVVFVGRGDEEGVDGGVGDRAALAAAAGAEVTAGLEADSAVGGCAGGAVFEGDGDGEGGQGEEREEDEGERGE